MGREATRGKPARMGESITAEDKARLDRRAPHKTLSVTQEELAEFARKVRLEERARMRRAGLDRAVDDQWRNVKAAALAALRRRIR